MFKKGFFISTFIYSLISNAIGLEIDSELTIQILKASRSKKTILINKGRESNLVLGDHAKLFVSEGVVARAVISDISAKRSVWSVYRVTTPDLINPGEMMNIKITPQVKLTKDPLSVVIADSAYSETIADNIKDKEFSVYSDLVDDTTAPKSPPPTVVAPIRTFISDISDRDLEFWLSFGLQSFSSEVSGSADGSKSRTAGEFINNILLGMNKYFGNGFGVFGFVQYSQESLLSFDGAITDSSLIEGGGGAELYLFSNPHKVGKIIPYLTVGAGLGSVVDAFAAGELVSGAQDTTELSGSSFSVFGGGGFKYHLQNGFGARLILDFYNREDTFKDTQDILGTEQWTRTKQGPRIMLGLSYRI
jgi:hypothetical protein